jgi:hypothetical protein
MRLILNFDSIGKTTVLTLLKTPWVAESYEARRIRISPLLGGNAQSRGEELVRLLFRHKPIKQALAMALARPPASPPQPIYFRVVSDAADELPWEQLYSAPQGFVALDSRWPLGRIVKRVQDLSDRSFLPPFRIVAVLAAAGREGQPQLDALAGAVARARADGLDALLHVITAEQAVIDRVAALQTNSVRAEWIGATPMDLARQITDAKPSILHLLCHGGFAAPGVRGLAFATIQDFLAQDTTGSVVLGVDGLTRALALCDPWLVVLAACETAQASDGTALAHSLVDAGVPAVIGMRRLVDLGTMNGFCEALYPEILSKVAKAVDPTPGKERVQIDWASALTAPRQAATVGHDPSLVDTWSDAVLYAQQDELSVYVPTKQSLSAEQYAALRGRLDTYLQLRLTQDPATTPPGVLEEIDRTITELKALLPGQPDE